VNIIEYALKMEREGEKYYRDLAAKAGNKGIEGIFHSLADAEAKHYQALLRLRDNLPLPVYDENILLHAKSIFQQMSLDQDPINPRDDQLAAYKKARQIEKESRGFYLQKAEELTNQGAKELCLKIAAAEQQHYILLDAMVDFISSPDTWLENAEWNHLDNY